MKQTAFFWGGGEDYAECLQMESISLISWGVVYMNSYMGKQTV